MRLRVRYARNIIRQENVAEGRIIRQENVIECIDIRQENVIETTENLGTGPRW